MNRSLFKETSVIFFLQMRQHRLKLILWFISIVGLNIAVAYIFPILYSNPLDLYSIALTMQNPAMIALLGPAAAPQDYSPAVAFSGEMLLFTAVTVAIMNILLVSAMTRLDEEEGRLELIQSLAVGRLAYATSSILLMLVVNGGMAVGIILGFLPINDPSFSFESSLLYGSLQGLIGWFFAGLTLVCSQLSATSRGSRGLAFAFLGLAYSLRAIGDVSSEFLSMLSPLGWLVRSDPFLTNSWWPVYLLGGASVFLIGLGFFLNQRRDILQGLLKDRPGKARASAFLQTFLGFIWSQEKTLIWSWAIGMFVMALSFGAILNDLELYLTDVPLIQVFLPDLGSASMTEAFTRLIFAIMSVFTAIPALSVILQLQKEETLSRMDHFYSRSLPRTTVFLHYYGMSLAVLLLIQFLLAFGIFLAAFMMMDQPLSVNFILESAVLYLPANWFMIGLAALLIGKLPRFTPVIWGYLAFVFIQLYLGNLLDLPDWVNQLSIYHHIPLEFEWRPLLTQSVLALFMTFVGVWSYRRRDIVGD